MNTTKPIPPLKRLLENAARCGETACVSAHNAEAAQELARENHLDVEIYVIPEDKQKPQPV